MESKRQSFNLCTNHYLCRLVCWCAWFTNKDEPKFSGNHHYNKSFRLSRAHFWVLVAPMPYQDICQHIKSMIDTDDDEANVKKGRHTTSMYFGCYFFIRSICQQEIEGVRGIQGRSLSVRGTVSGFPSLLSIILNIGIPLHSVCFMHHFPQHKEGMIVWNNCYTYKLVKIKNIFPKSTWMWGWSTICYLT